MAYQFGKKKLAAIEKDRERLGALSQSKKIKEANSAFIGDDLGNWNPNGATENVIKENGIQQIKLDDIKEREVNNFANISLETLKKSISKLGLISPIVVKHDTDSKYTIISGHRRYNAYKELYFDTKDNKYLTIPAIIFFVEDDNSVKLGTNPKYITKQQEEEMYEAANLENRQISKQDLAKHITYFYNLIKDDGNYKQQLLDENNKNAERKATKLNLQKTISSIVTKDLGFNVSPTTVWRLVWIIENKEEYPKYYKKIEKRLNEGQEITNIYKDFDMAIKIKNGNFEKAERQEYLDRLEKGDEKVIDIYSEAFNVKNTSKQKENIKDYFRDLLNRVKKGSLSIDDAINEFDKKYQS